MTATTCTWPTDLRLLDPTTLLPFLNLHDHAAGLDLMDGITLPDDEPRQRREKGAGYHGSVGFGPLLDDDGTYGVVLEVTGSTWAVMTARFQAARTLLRSRSRFIVEEELSGVRTRWFCDAPVAIRSVDVDVAARRANIRTFELRFLVQANPSVTIVEE